MGRGVNLWAACVGAAPERARRIACGKLRSGAVSNTVPFRKGSASSLHHRDAACDAIELGKSIQKETKPARRQTRVPNASTRRQRVAED